MDQWDAAVISEKDGEKFRFISTENSDGVLDQQYYPDTKDGKLYLSLMSGLNVRVDKVDYSKKVTSRKNAGER